MNLQERIERRLGPNRDDSLIDDYDAISPISHVSEPNGREQVLERLLDALEPAFEEDRMASNIYVRGPKGSGKSAVLTSLFAHLDRLGRRHRAAIPTSTRATVPEMPSVAYVDSRFARTEFALVHAVLDSITDDHVPKRGLGTDVLRDRLRDRIQDTHDAGVVIAIDHLDEPRTCSVDDLSSIFEALEGSVSVVAIGESSPPSIDDDFDLIVECEPYERHDLVDIVSSRAAAGLGHRAISHDQILQIVDWADGDAHDALAAMFGAAISAERQGRASIGSADLVAGISSVPKPGISLGRVVSLPENSQRMLHELVALDTADRASVEAATDAIRQADGIGLSETTVSRLLYELANAGILERSPDRTSGGKGRPPSRLEPRFSTLAFERLSEHGR